jgi:hypothetical protein
LACALDLATPGEASPVGVARLLAALARRDRWLVVFDNAEDPTALTPYLPQGPGRVVITSRNPHWRRVATPVGVNTFACDESITLLGRLSPEVTVQDADRVAHALGDLPLAVERAGALLGEGALDPATYLRLLAQAAERVLAQDTRGNQAVSVAASWTVAFDRLAADHPPALDVLTIVAWCGPEPVPLTLFTDNPDALPRRCARWVIHWGCQKPWASCGDEAWRSSPRTPCSCIGSRPHCCGAAPSMITPTPGVGHHRAPDSAGGCAGGPLERSGDMAALAAAAAPRSGRG